MISCPLSEISQPSPSQSQASASFTSVIPSSSFCLLHNDRHGIYHKNKDSSANKKHKKPFRTAKFLFPIQMNMAAHYQYPPILPQISNSNIASNMYDPISLSISSFQQPSTNRTHKHIKPNHKMDTQILVENCHDKTKEDQNIPITSDDYSTFEKENKCSHDSKKKNDDSVNHGSFEEKTNINTNNDIFDIEFQSSPSASELSRIDVSNICFDIVKRGNFPSIIVKNGYVEIIQ